MRVFVGFSTLLIMSFLLAACGSASNSTKDMGAEEQEEVIEEEQVAQDIDVEQENEAEEQEEIEEELEETKTMGNYDAYIGGEMVEEDGKIIIHGESNLLPGARVVGEVLVGDSEEESEFFSDTSEIVQDDGSFYMELAHHDSNEETNVTIKFNFDGQQDDEIKRHYGDRGQKLEGPYIYKHQGEVGGGRPDNIFKMAKATTSFEPTGEKSIRHFKEANWYPIPEDMGDPRVWIEVDEINNDEENYYLQGRSNLSEGAVVFVTYGTWRDDETRILPDGSFHLKRPYEYKEDTNFTVEFYPDHWEQWNEVIEKYGSKGQNLVGDLVVQDKHSDKQFIEKVIEQESQLIDMPDNVELEIVGTEVTMLVPDDILFDYDKYDLKKEAKETLDEISDVLASSFNKKEFDIVINGHTDNSGSKEYNKKLSKQRADEVKKHFDEKLNSKEIKFTTEGYGDEKPIASNDTEKGQAKNRRVEIVINLAD